MGIFNRLLPRAPEARSADFRSFTSFEGLSSVGQTNLITVHACQSLLAEAVAGMPIDTFRKVPGGIADPLANPAWIERPNVDMFSVYDLLEQIMMSLLEDGNAYVAVLRDGAGGITELWVLSPAAVSVRRVAGRRVYSVSGVEDQVEILHVRGLTKPGALKGISPLAVGRMAIEAGVSTDQFAASFWTNGARPGGVVEIPGEAEDDDITRIGEAWSANHGGPRNTAKTAFLVGGAKYTPISITSADAQFLESRIFTNREIGKLYRVPGHLIGDLEKASYNSVEIMSIEFVVYSLLTWMTRLERALSTLLPIGQIFKLNEKGLLRGSFREQLESLAIALQNGIMNRDEVRDKLDLPPLPDGLGQQFDRPLNVAAITQDDGTTSTADLVRAIQQVYLGVGKVITADEARVFLNRLGADLSGPAPSSEQDAA